ncbi:heat-inducible transcription repressor HrcA [bacterium endosymbiont of Escarpia laminata]|nr:MAG: heat-inducible transcription repressor HrcA [bacterium endosymbiont of Escarpia laminata]
MAAKKVISESGVGERAQHFLKVLIERYIRDGQPVGSRTLAKDAGMDLSPATIRNVMCDLEDLGLVASPHTSAGRIPTVTGFRMFIDSLLTVQRLQAGEIERIRTELAYSGDAGHLLASASQLLSGVTHMAGIVTIPRRERTAFRQIEFLPLSENRVLAILVTNDGEVANRILNTHRDFTRLELDQAANFLNHSFSGLEMKKVRSRVLEELNAARKSFDQTMAQALEMAGEVVDASTPREDCLIAGQTNLMEFEDLASLQQLRKLFDAFAEKRERCQPWRAKRRLVVPGSREAALLTRRALRQRGSKVGIRARRPVIGSWQRSGNELARLSRSASDRDGRGTNRLSKAESILGTGMSQNLSRGRRLT